jgi:hypothetical protein
VSLNIIENVYAAPTWSTRIGLCVETAILESALSLVTSRDVDVLFEKFGMTLTNGTSIDHNEGSIVTSCGHDDTGHVLVTARDRDVGIVTLGAGDGFDGVGDQLAAL